MWSQYCGERHQSVGKFKTTRTIIESSRIKYQYEIEDRVSGVKTKFESSYEEAIERLDRTNAIVDSPLYYTQDGGSMCNGIGRSYF